jgi:hypothetical protein
MSQKFVKGLSKLCKNTTGEEKLQLDINDVTEALTIPAFSTMPDYSHTDNKAYLYFNTTSNYLKIQYNGTVYTFPHN